MHVQWKQHCNRRLLTAAEDWSFYGIKTGNSRRFGLLNTTAVWGERSPTRRLKEVQCKVALGSKGVTDKWGKHGSPKSTSGGAQTTTWLLKSHMDTPGSRKKGVWGRFNLI